MPSKVYYNVEGSRVINDGRVTEDVTSVSLPTISHPTTSIDALGMALAIDMPDPTRIEAMEFGISHNNGLNGRYLSEPGRHFIETRVVRQRYDVAIGEVNHESVKVRVTCMHKSTEKGTIETGNPYGSTEKYSVMRYEEEINGEIVTVVDSTGIVRWNGKDYRSVVESMLN
jgi:phage tail tube protein FII